MLLAPEYKIEMSWHWGGQRVIATRFDDVHRFTVRNLEEIAPRARRFLIRVARRYAFDCGRLHLPLLPSVGTIKITPIFETVYISGSELGLDTFLDDEVAETKRLIETGQQHVDGRHNLEPAYAHRDGDRVMGFSEFVTTAGVTGDREEFHAWATGYTDTDGMGYAGWGNLFTQWLARQRLATFCNKHGIRGDREMFIAWVEQQDIDWHEYLVSGRWILLWQAFTSAQDFADERNTQQDALR
jgi:hypothetical protein